MVNASILCVSTDGEVIEDVRQQVAAMGYRFLVAGSMEEAAGLQAQEPVNALLVQTDATEGSLPVRLGEELPRHNGVPVIVLARRRSIRDAVTLIRAGAADYLSALPANPESLRIAIESAISQSPEQGWTYGLAEWAERFGTADGHLMDVLRCMAAVADTRAPILIQGESGVGKTFLARIIHEHSCRRLGPFLEVNCGALSESLLDSELFGHAKGAFTGAYVERAGKFEAADHGTLLLDEVDSATASLQVRLLRVVEAGEFERVGDTSTLRSDVRLIVTSSASLASAVEDGRFREDLYHRLNAFNVEIPPLRERVADIPPLARRLLRDVASHHRRDADDLSPEVLDRLVHYPWPGNVRELRNVIEHCVILSNGAVVTLDSLPKFITDAARFDAPNSSAGRLQPLRDALRDPERDCIMRALQLCGGNKQQAAQDLGISRSTLYKKIRELNVERDDEVVTRRLAGRPVMAGPLS